MKDELGGGKSEYRSIFKILYSEFILHPLYFILLTLHLVSNTVAQVFSRQRPGSS